MWFHGKESPMGFHITLATPQTVFCLLRHKPALNVLSRTGIPRIPNNAESIGVPLRIFTLFFAMGHFSDEDSSNSAGWPNNSIQNSLHLAFRQTRLRILVHQSYIFNDTRGQWMTRGFCGKIKYKYKKNVFEFLSSFLAFLWGFQRGLGCISFSLVAQLNIYLLCRQFCTSKSK